MQQHSLCRGSPRYIPFSPKVKIFANRNFDTRIVVRFVIVFVLSAFVKTLSGNSRFYKHGVEQAGYLKARKSWPSA